MFDNPQNDVPTMIQARCPMCGGENFEWGRLGSQTYYLPGMNLFSRRGANYIRVRRCLQCNNLALFTHEKLTAQIRLMVAVIILIGLLVLLFAIFLPIFLGVHR